MDNTDFFDAGAMGNSGRMMNGTTGGLTRNVTGNVSGGVTFGIAGMGLKRMLSRQEILLRNEYKNLCRGFSRGRV